MPISIQHCVLAITACRNLRLTWFLIRWNRNFMGLLNIQKYSVAFFRGLAEFRCNQYLLVNWSGDVDDLDLVVFEHRVVYPQASSSSPLIHQRTAWLQWCIFSILLVLPRVSGSYGAQGSLIFLLHRHRLLYCLLLSLFHWITLHPVQNMYQTSIPLQCVSNSLFNECSFTPDGLRMKELCSYYSGTTICPEEFQNV